MNIANVLTISSRAMRAVDLPHQGLLDVTDLGSNDLQLVIRDIATLVAKMHHHDVPSLVSVILPPVPLKLLKGLLSIVDANQEVVQGLAVAVVELVDPLDAALQILDSLLDLNDGDIESTVADSLIFETANISSSSSLMQTSL